MINLDIIANENNKEHNKKLPYIPDHQYKILIIGGYWSGKANALLNLIKEQDDIDKIYLYAKDLTEPNYEFLIKKREDVGTNRFNDPNAFEYLSVQIRWMTFMKILVITIKAEKEKV